MKTHSKDRHNFLFSSYGTIWQWGTARRDHCRKGPLPEGTAAGREQFYMQCCYNVHSFSTLGLVAVNFCYLIFLSGFYSLFLDFVIWLWWRFERNVSLYVLQDALILSYPPHVSLILSLSYPLNRRLLSYPISRRTCHKIHSSHTQSFYDVYRIR